MNIIFICLGNICRSPLAEAIANKYIQDNKITNISISSAGTGDWHIGHPPCDKSQKIAKQFSLDISKYKASQISSKHINDYDYYLVVDDTTYKNVLSLGINEAKILKLSFFGLDSKDIKDIYFVSEEEEIKDIFLEIELSVHNFIKHIIK